MRVRNSEFRYSLPTKLLHWLTVVAIAAQFVVGLNMEPDDGAFDREESRIDRLEETGREPARRRGDDAEEAFENEIDRLRDELDAREDAYVSDAFSDVFSGSFLGEGLSLAELHVLVGLSVLVLGVIRIVWRATTPIPAWAEHLSARERQLEGVIEKLLLSLLLIVPGTGLLLVVGDEDWLPVHVTAQLAFLVVLGLHLGFGPQTHPAAPPRTFEANALTASGGQAAGLLSASLCRWASRFWRSRALPSS